MCTVDYVVAVLSPCLQHRLSVRDEGQPRHYLASRDIPRRPATSVAGEGHGQFLLHIGVGPAGEIEVNPRDGSAGKPERCLVATRHG